MDIGWSRSEHKKSCINIYFRVVIALLAIALSFLLFLFIIAALFCQCKCDMTVFPKCFGNRAQVQSGAA